MSEYVWMIRVRCWNTYGDRVESTVPAAIIAATRSEVTEKVRTAFDATYDNFRGLWSHDWVLERMDEHRPTEGDDHADT